MTLSSRNSSPIKIGDVTYRWAVDSRSQAETDCVTFVVQPPDHGQRIAVQIPCRDYWPKFGEPEPEFNYQAVTPGLVRKVIDLAIELGWVPDHKGKQLSFTFQQDETLMET